VGWGSTFGAIKAATLELRASGINAAAAQVRYLNPLPKNLGELLGRFKHVLIPEMNLGQFRDLIRAKYLVDAHGLNKVRGQPFTIGEILRGAHAVLDGRLEALEYNFNAGADSSDVMAGG
jgi:2-oxoglutarate ferredoxin oxidoreductase subunit alpha